MFIFGDSFWDIGNNKYAVATHKNVIPLNIPPYGVDYVPSSGRCSNGQIIPDYLGTHLLWNNGQHEEMTHVCHMGGGHL